MGLNIAAEIWNIEMWQQKVRSTKVTASQCDCHQEGHFVAHLQRNALEEIFSWASGYDPLVK
jgi:hypothetical protein